MKNNLKISNIVMSGRIPINRRLSVEDYEKLINNFNWNVVECGENMPSRYSKKFFIRDKKEMSVHNREKAPYVTLFHLGGIIIVGLKSKKEGNIVYDLVIKELKKVCPKKLK